ncbi:hypothetical protein [Blastopirellula marina]|uniref:YrhK domain-containing protein n=1 Tax=Blastopirellula marina TaxID=124 RepID=A0A2S8GLJ6_9BACT|nr:hypothetical protein [Blastopirellula marina]PQO45305.1 hypothetical protein C5Y93_15235 [Blastopirellula marina]
MHKIEQEFEQLEAEGIGGFVSHRVLRHESGEKSHWHSRNHRKGLVLRKVQGLLHFGQLLVAQLWQPRQLNWWIGSLFAFGSTLFALASVVLLWPDLGEVFSLSAQAANLIYFLGSIPFTTAAYLQLFQAANARPAPGEKEAQPQLTRLLGWRPHDIGWVSCALQFPGTVLFNFTTFDAMIPSLNWVQTNLWVWAPNFIGSVLFLASGYLAFAEVAHRWWAVRPKNISWWVVFANLLGCIGFMISALFAFALPGPAITWMEEVDTLFTLQGAICFGLGGVLMLPEAAE